MEFDELLRLVGDDPVFESSLLLAGNINPKIVRLQLTRWVNSRRIYRLRRGLYSIAPPYQKIQPHPFLVANHLQRSSYVSLQSALAFYGLIPENVNITVSVTPGRPERLETPLGIFEFRHIKSNLLFGYQMIDLGGQNALVATPEKALLDLVYLQPGGESPNHLHGLRLQNLDHLNLGQLKKQSKVFDSPKMSKAAKVISQLMLSETSEYEEL
ncbi:MAG: type IV toxin-antitoxin system AbiEi family antitoxin domain-containing protein [Bellilinea sp.]